MIHFLSVFPPYRGGISNFSDYLYRHLIEKVEVNPVNFKKLYPSLLFPGKTQYLESEVDNYSQRKLHSYNPLNWINTGKEIAQQRPKVLLISFWHPFFIPAYNQIIKQVLKNSPETKICTLAHNVKPHEHLPFSDQLIRSFFKKNNLVIVLSEQTKAEFQNLNLNTPVTKIFHPVYSREKPNGTKKILRQKYDLSENDNILLFFGLVREYKGLDIMIKALNKMDLTASNIRPFIVGEFYSDKNKYLGLINEEHLDQYIIIDRFVSQHEADEIFSISDALLLPYKTASQSGVFNDALNFHLPSIVADHPGLTEYVSHKETGLVFESENVDNLVEVLTQFLSNTDLKEDISTNLTLLEQQLSWGKFTSQLMEELEIKA